MEQVKREIKQVLKNNPNGLMAKEIARLLGENKSRINSILYSSSSEFVMNNYIWKNRNSDDDISEPIFRVEAIPAVKRNDGVRYHYYNCNPHRKLTDDCVIRAISAMTGAAWEDVIRDLTETAIETGYMINTPECYSVYLERNGFEKRKQPVKPDGKKVKFKEFVQSFNGHAFCHCGKNHVTYVADNSTWDIWDVSEEIVGNYWTCDD